MLVMLQHCAGSFGTNIFTPFGGTGVAMFLILSGFGLNESRKNKGMDNFWKKKATRIFLPWLLFCLVTTSLCSPFNWKAFVESLLCVEHYWYVKYLFYCYAVYWLSNHFFFRFRWWLFGAFALCSFFGMESLQAEQALSFLLGVLISEKKDAVDSMSGRADISVCVACIATGLCFLFIKQLPCIREHIETPLYYAVQMGIKLPLAIGIMLLLWLLPHRFSMNRLFVFWGIISYELYLVHMKLLQCGIVDSSFVQALSMMIIATLLSYSFFIFNGNLKNLTYNCQKPWRRSKILGWKKNYRKH